MTILFAVTLFLVAVGASWLLIHQAIRGVLLGDRGGHWFFEEDE